MRIANGSDSAVTIGCVARGRSFSYCLNNILRKHMYTQILGRKQITDYHASGEHNEAVDRIRKLWLGLRNLQLNGCGEPCIPRSLTVLTCFPRMCSVGFRKRLLVRLAW